MYTYASGGWRRHIIIGRYRRYGIRTCKIVLKQLFPWLPMRLFQAIDMVEIKSSLGLQQVIFYQGMCVFVFKKSLLIDQSRFSLLYFAICGGCLLNKLQNYKFQNSILFILTLPIFSLWCCIEIVRIGLGYIGNLLEKVPMISAFLLLTIFPQLVAILFLTFLQDPV